MRSYYLLALPVLALTPLPVLANPTLQDQIYAVAASDADQQSVENAKAARIHAAALQEQRRNQAYVDRLRNTRLEESDLDLQVKKAKVARVNEYIDQDLKGEAAINDVIQSNADALRNVSEGAKAKLTSDGRANEKRAKGFWN